MTRGWLLDTNVVSELRKPHCSPRVKAWAEARPASVFFLSTVTLAEIRFGIERVPAGSAFRNDLERWLATELRRWFAGRILELDEEVVLTWRRLVKVGRSTGRTFAQPDLCIAATALVHGLVVATRNVGDFEPAGVRVLDPWSEAAADGT